jgi:CheY-like chemotaxis protein
MMASVEPKAQGKPAPEAKAILFVEDDEDDFIVAWHQLRKMKVANRATRVNTVEEMIAYLEGTGKYSDRKEYPLPTVIFLDLRLPLRGGLEAQAWLRSKLKYRNIPIILISTPEMVSLLESAVRLGANAYMLKPFDNQHFRRLILEHRLPVQFA